MPLTQRNQINFHRRLYAGELKSILLLRRLSDQQNGTVTTYRLFACRRGQISKTGEPIQQNMSSNHSTVWHIPRQELNRVGIQYIDALDRIVETTNDGGTTLPVPQYWQPESTTVILEKLFELMINVDCLLVNQPLNPNT